MICRSFLLLLLLLHSCCVVCSNQSDKEMKHAAKSRNDAPFSISSISRNNRVKSLFADSARNFPVISSANSNITVYEPPLFLRHPGYVFGHVIGRKLLKANIVFFACLLVYNRAPESGNPRLSPAHVYIALADSMRNAKALSFQRINWASKAAMTIQVMTVFESFILHTALWLFQAFESRFLWLVFIITAVDFVLFWMLEFVR